MSGSWSTTTWLDSSQDFARLHMVLRKFRSENSVVECNFCHTSNSVWAAFIDYREPDENGNDMFAFCDQECMDKYDIQVTIEATEEARQLLGAPSLFEQQYPLPEKIGKPDAS